MTGIGRIDVRQPRGRDPAADNARRIRFTPAILPPYTGRSRSLEMLIPILYLKGISTGDFEEALAALFGKDPPGLWASTSTRLKEFWLDEHDHWRKRVRPSPTSIGSPTAFTCRPVLQTRSNVSSSSSARRPRAKKLLGVTDGARESAQDWRELLLDLRNRSLAVAPELAVTDGALGFWKALGELWPTTREQRCWVAAECLANERHALLAFYDYPAEHWKHLRTSNPIESTFATVRHPTIRLKRCLSNKTALAMVFKLVDAAQKSWRRLDDHNQLPKLIQGVTFTDGIEVAVKPASRTVAACTLRPSPKFGDSSRP